jgi:histidine triad (HIT) family protein
LFNHEPPDYDCSFCQVVAGQDNEWNVSTDVVYRSGHVTAFVNAMWWPRNKGHVLVVPNDHIENIYDLGNDVAASIHEVTRRVAIAFMETYGCDGTSTRQHNGPGGGQEVWHYHVHVFPRFVNDGLYGSRRRMTTSKERRPYADRLRGWFART